MSALKQKIIKCINEILKGVVNNVEDYSKNKDGTTSCVYCHEQTSSDLKVVLEGKLQIYETTAQELGVLDFIQQQQWHVTRCSCSKDGEFVSLHTSPCFDDIEWRFLQVCLKLLLSLIEVVRLENVNIEEVKQNVPNFFGVNDEKTVICLVELVVIIGIIPQYLPSIGLPFKLTTDLKPLKKKFHPRLLYSIIEGLFVLLENKMLSSILLPKLCSDLIASLIQLQFTPPKLMERALTSCMCQSSSGICSRNLCCHELSWCKLELNKLLTQTYQPLIVKELLRLQTYCRNHKNQKSQWFLRVIGQFLSKCILQKDGVKTVIKGILDGCNIDSMSWYQFESVGKIIAHAPSQSSSIEEYYKIVCPQILHIVQTESMNQFRSHSKLSQFFLVSLGCIEEMLQNHTTLSKKLLLKPMLHPLQQCLSKVDTVTITERELLISLSCLHSLCNCGNITDDFFHKLASVSHVLFILSIMPCIGKSVRVLSEDILEIIFHKLKGEERISLLNLIMFWQSEELNNDVPENTQQSMAVCQSVYINLNINLVLEDVDTIDSDKTFDGKQISTDERIDGIRKLLKNEKTSDTRGDFFISLLSRLSLVTNNKKKKQKTTINSHHSEELLELDYVIDELRYKIELVSLISAMIDNFGHSVLQNTPQIVAFIENILNLTAIEDVSLLDRGGFHEETIDLALMLVSTLLGTNQLTSSDYIILSNLVPSLDKIMHCHSNKSSRVMANDLKVFILTRGATKPNVGVSTTNTDATKSSADFYTENDLQSKATYEKALKELSDPLLPTRGHALILLTKLLKERNRYAVRDGEKLLAIFEANVCHDDTYLYLSSIEGLVTLVDLHHEKVLPLLCRKFAKFPDEASSNTISSELRMKLCEAIVKSCELCGDMLPKYSAALMSSLMTGVKDEDSSIRASSLSAIGDVCKLLRFSISSIITEVFSCVYAVLESDQSINVRRAAVQVFELMFKGLGSNIMQMIPDMLRDIYRLLKKVYSFEADDITKLHADNALNILDEIMKDSLTLNPEFSRKVSIL